MVFELLKTLGEEGATLPFPINRIGLAAGGKVERAFARCAYLESMTTNPCSYDQRLS
jgi:hypothetical protein